MPTQILMPKLGLTMTASDREQPVSSAPTMLFIVLPTDSLASMPTVSFSLFATTTLRSLLAWRNHSMPPLPS